MKKLIWNKISAYINRLENTNVSFWEVVFLLCGIFFIRTFLENYANSGNSYHMSSAVDTFFHYPFGFLIVILGSIIIGTLLTREKILKVAKFITLCSFGLILPPVIDLILNKGGQIPYIFLSGSWSELLRSYLAYFGGGAIGTGIRLEILFALTGMSIYIFYKTGRWFKSILGIIILYTIIFIFLSSPAFIFGLWNSFTGHYSNMDIPSIVDFYYHLEPISAVSGNRTFLWESGSFYSSSASRIMNQYSTTLAIVFLLIDAILFFWCLFLYSKEKFLAVIKNFRYLRIIHNSILISLGLFLGIGFSGKIPLVSLFDVLSLLSLFLSFLFGWLFVVWENDEADVEIDKITNKDRPLAQDQALIPKEEWRILKQLFLLFSLSFAYLTGLYSLVFILLFIFIYHIYQVYSIPPTRLKQFPVISSFLIAIISLILVWMGFFFAAGTEALNAFPPRFIWGILLIILLVENAKNLKDIEGDRREGIKTLPVILGDKWGKVATAFGLFLGAFLVPLVFFFTIYTFILSIFFGVIFFFLAVRENYKEKYLFLTYFFYVLTFFVFLYF